METSERLPAQGNIQLQHINTEGGTAITGSVDTGGGDFVGRDKVIQQSVDASIRIAIATEGGTISNSPVTIGNVSTNVYQNVRPTPLDKATLDAALDTLSRLPLNSIPPIAVLPMGSRIPYSVNPLFVGREKELLTLAAYLKGGETIAIGQIAAATGLGGIGKTQLAAAFVHYYGQFFVGGVHWLSFADPKSVPAEIVACGMMMPDLRADYATLDFETQVRLVLAAWQSPLPRLLIFDNCQEPTLLIQWRPPTGGSRVLVTSRRHHWDISLGVSMLTLNTLSREQSINLLHKFRPDLHQSEPLLDEIANELGDLPLALHLAGSYLALYRYVISLPQYLVKLRDSGLLGHSSMQTSALSPTGHVQDVARTFAISYERLQPDNSLNIVAKELLICASYFAPGQLIPRGLLLSCLHLENDDDVLIQSENALHQLLNLGLLEMDAMGDVLLHRLVAYFIQCANPTSTLNAQQKVATTLLEAATRVNNSGMPRSLLIWQSHLRHVTDIMRHNNNEQAAEFCNTLGYHLELIGDYVSAKDYFEQASAINESLLGKEHSATASTYHNLGCLLQYMGDYAAAKPYCEMALSIRETLLGHEHLDTARSCNNLGNLLLSIGEYAAAKPYYERALTIYKALLGLEHPDVAVSYNNLGSLLQAMGDYAKAKSYFEQAITICETKLGTEHHTTALSYNNMGMLLNAIGESSSAKPYYERALAIRESVLGNQHPDTARSYNNLGKLLNDMGEPKAAKFYYEQALAINETLLGPTHPATARSYNNLGMLLKAMGDYDTSKTLLERSLAIRENTLGSDHPATARSYSNLGNLLQGIGDYSSALSYLERAVVIREKSLGQEHPDTIRSYNNLGKLLQRIGEPDAAQPYFELARAMSEKNLGLKHSHIQTVRSNLAALENEGIS